MPPPTWRVNPDYSEDITIDDGAQLSSAVDLKNKSLCGLTLPSAFTGTSLTFYAATTVDGTYKEMTDAAGGAAITATVAPDKFVVIEPSYFLGVRFLKVRSDVVEGGARTVTLIVRPLDA